MIRITPLVLLCAVLSSALATEKPNILLIMADDLGYSDLGCYGGEIQTPNLDSVAESGLRFTEFYNTARCWPTRASLLTGYYAQQVRRDTLPGGLGGPGGKRPDWAPLLPELLKPAGYRSYHTGKWHLQGKPVMNGFDRSYYLNDQDRFFNPTNHLLDDKRLPPVKKGTDFYATTALADHAIETLQDHAENHADAPFFHYLAFTAPHFPLQALPEDIAIYDEIYRQGWAAIRAKRFARQREMGLLDERAAPEVSEVERELWPPRPFPKALEILGSGEVNRPLPWDELTEEQKRFQAKKMAIHAAMVHRMDIEIGRVFDQIKNMGEWENTLVIFLSDNGASAEMMIRADGHDPAAPAGSAASYLCLGPGWATVSNTPFRRYKKWTHEGGISTPFIVSWPRRIDAHGEFRRSPAHVIDIAATLLDLAGAERPQTAGPAAPGKSLAPAFQDGSIEHEVLWWLHVGNKAVRMGDWKAVAPKGQPWALYNLAEDRVESNDLAESHPEKLQQLVTEWQRKVDHFREYLTIDSPPEMGK